MSDITSQQLVVFSLGSEEYAPPDRRGPRDHPLHRAALRRLRRAVDPRRHRPARQDHPDLRPRRPHGPRRRRRRARQDRHRRDRHRPGRRHRRRRRGGPDRHRATSSRPSRPPTPQTIEAIAKIDDRLVILLNPEGLFARAARRRARRGLDRAVRWPRVTNTRAARRRRRRLAPDAPHPRRRPRRARASTWSPRAADGDEALAACDEHRPDAMTLDLHMPGLDGLGVLRALRAGKAEPVPGRRRLRLLPRPRRPRRRRAGRGRLRPRRQAGDRRVDGRLHRRARPARSTTPPTAASRAAPRRRVAAARRAAAPPRRRAPRRRARAAAARKKFVVIASSTGGPKALGELVPQLPAPLGAGVADRPAHAARLHRLARRAPGRHVRADRPRGRRRRGARPAAPAARARRLAPAHGRRPPRAPAPTTRRWAACARAPTSRSPTPPRVYGPALRAGRADRHGQGRPRRRRAPSRPPAAASSSRPSRPASSTACRARWPRPASPTRSCRSTSCPPRSPGRPAMSLATRRTPPRTRRRARPRRRDAPRASTAQPRAADDFVALCELVRPLCGVDLLPVQAQPDGAPRAHLGRAPRHAGPRRVRRAPAQATRRSSTPSWTA